jgi:hypothetical protein
MRTRIRIGPFTFGHSGIRFSPWRRGTGFSIFLFKRNARSFGKVKLGMFSFFFQSRSGRRTSKPVPENVKEIRRVHRQAYKPWTTEADEKLVYLFRQGKTVDELSEIFGRTKGAIRSRINKLLLQ